MQSTARTSTRISLDASDDVPVRVREHATERIARAASRAPHPVLRGRVVLRQAHNPSLTRPATCKVVLDVSGTPVCAHVAASEPYAAIDLASARLEDSLRRLGERERADRRWHGEVEPGSWRHGARAARRPEMTERGEDERELRSRSVDAAPRTAVDAAFDMELRDHDFELFVDADGRIDGVVHRAPDGFIGLRRVDGSASGDLPGWMRADSGSAPALTVEAARERLAAGGEPFVLFVDAETGRGAVVYRRFDGHDGLLALAPAGRSPRA
jgi:ribosome-associated translation inhibitor RaiA